MFRHLTLGALVALSLGFSPVASAYTPTAAEGFSVDGKTAVFFIDYRFGHESYDLTMPLHASEERGGPQSLRFDVRDADNEPGNGTALGIILSNAPVKNGAYVAPKGYATDFRLLVLYTRTDDEAGESFRANVTGLPFAFRGVRDLSLNSSELKAYVTPLVKLSPTLETKTAE